MKRSNPKTTEAKGSRALRVPLTERAAIDPWRVAAQLRHFRDTSKYSLQKLADKTKEYDPSKRGVSAAHISRIEQGKTDPTLFDVYVISQALGLRITDVAIEDSWMLNRAADQLRQLDSTRNAPLSTARPAARAHREMVEKRVYRYVPLIPGPDSTEGSKSLNKNWIMQKFLFEVGESEDVILDGHDGEEVLVVLSGSMEAFLEESKEQPPQKIVLNPGDCLQYKAAIRHGYRAIRQEESGLIPNPEGSGHEAIARALFVYVWRGEPADLRVKLPPEHY